MKKRDIIENFNILLEDTYEVSIKADKKGENDDPFRPAEKFFTMWTHKFAMDILFKIAGLIKLEMSVLRFIEAP